MDQTLMESRELDALFDTIVRQRQELNFYSAARSISSEALLSDGDDHLEDQRDPYYYLGARDAVIAESKLNRGMDGAPVQKLTEEEWKGRDTLVWNYVVRS
jgi:hypothetical protein